MTPEHGHRDSTEARQQEILFEAAERYGKDAHFVYLRPSDSGRQPELVVMTLEEAMAICGRHMAHEAEGVLWATLDRWHEAAQKLAKHPALFQAGLALGRRALVQRGIEVQ